MFDVLENILTKNVNYLKNTIAGTFKKVIVSFIVPFESSGSKYKVITGL